MISSVHAAFSLLTLSTIAVCAILRRKSSPRNAANEEDIISELADIISEMPDDILVSILTRMPTKFAIRTSILSKRWRNLYKFVSDINLDFGSVSHAWYDADWYRSEVIISRLKSFARLRLSSASKSRSFHFRCCLTKSYANQIEECIFSLEKLSIEYLTLCFCYRCMSSNNLSFPCHLLSEMPSVKYFHMVGCFLQPNLKIRHNFLQTLSLMLATALPGGLECILSNCWTLRSLTAVHCVFPSKICFCGPNLQLKSLMISSCKGIEETEFYASNLITFEFHHSQVVNFIFDHVPPLQSIYLKIENNNIMPYVFGKLAKDLPHLKSLSFANNADLYQVSSRAMKIGIETFSNLRRLEMSLFGPPKINLLALIPVLQSCPLLQEFHLDTTNLKYDGAQVTNRNVLHSELKKVEIWGFEGTENEIELALYILKSAVMLEQMRISRCSKLYYVSSRTWRNLGVTPWSEETHENIQNKLQGQALSKTAQVTLQYAS